MTKKIENDGTRSENADSSPGEARSIEDGTKRKRLLARVAGYVASGLLVSPSPKVNSSETIATVAVDIAEAILKKVGL
jgi:hypothetical protein